MFNLLEIVQGAITPTVTEKLSRATGDSPTSTASGLAGIVPAIAAGIASKGSTAAGAAGLLGMAERSGLSASQLADPGAILSDSSALQSVSSGGSSILSSLFGNKLGMLGGMLGVQSGLSGKSTGMLMSFVAPLAMGLIGKHAKEGGMSAGDLASGLSSQSSHIAGLLPAGVRDLFGGGGEREAEPVRRVGTGDLARTAAPGPLEHRTSRLPLLAALAGGALLLFFVLRGREPPPAERARTSAAEGRDPGQRVARAGGELSGSLQQALREGSTTPVTFGSRSFEQGSANLTSAGQESLLAVASALRAVPSARATISGGAGDVTSGDRSGVASLRAKTLRDRLVSAGIDDSRIDVKGTAADSDTTMVVAPGSR